MLHEEMIDKIEKKKSKEDYTNMQGVMCLYKFEIRLQ